MAKATLDVKVGWRRKWHPTLTGTKIALGVGKEVGILGLAITPELWGGFISLFFYEIQVGADG